MLLNSATTITRKSPLCLRLASSLSPHPTSGASTRPLNPVAPLPTKKDIPSSSQIACLRSRLPLLSSQNPSPFSSVTAAGLQRLEKGFLGFKELGFRRLGMGYIPISAEPRGGGSGGIDGSRGSGGSGGGDGYSSGSGGAGGGGDGNSNSNWSILSWYLDLLEKFPVMTKAVTSALLTLVGDLICQLAIDKVQSLDLKRTFIFTLLGLALVGPTLHFWYLYLSRLVTRPGASGAVLRLLLDQFLFSPLFIGLFLSTLVTLEGRPSDVVPKLKQEWWSSVLVNWQLWIPFQFLNFRFVPQQFQVLAANFVALIWNVILSYKAHKEVVAK